MLGKVKPTTKVQQTQLGFPSLASNLARHKAFEHHATKHVQRMSPT